MYDLNEISHNWFCMSPSRKSLIPDVSVLFCPVLFVQPVRKKTQIYLIEQQQSSPKLMFYDLPLFFFIFFCVFFRLRGGSVKKHVSIYISDNITVLKLKTSIVKNHKHCNNQSC